MKTRWFNSMAWGSSVALSWMWGLGLFFSLQIAYLFGFPGLISFAIPNALGLFLFGFFTHRMAKKQSGDNSLEKQYTKWLKPFRGVFYLYQLIAISLTIFAFIRYFIQPLGIFPASLNWLILPMIGITLLAAVLFFSELLNIRTIKYSHLIFALLLLIPIIILAVEMDVFSINYSTPHDLPPLRGSMTYWGYLVPMVIGFLAGPWLDLQQWQRAIQMQKEKTSIRFGYFWGALFFFVLLLFHGMLVLHVIETTATVFHPLIGIDGHYYAHHFITHHVASVNFDQNYYILPAYALFVGICVLATLDSGFVALKWFLKKDKNSNNVLLALLPKNLLESPLPTFILAIIIALIFTQINLELEYFMGFYASFFITYAIIGFARFWRQDNTSVFPPLKVFGLSIISLALCTVGYMMHMPAYMIAAAILPLIYALAIIYDTRSFVKRVPILPQEIKDNISESPKALKTEKTETQTSEEKLTTTTSPKSETHPPAVQQAEMQTVGDSEAALNGYIEDKWFVYSFMTTLFETNSVGNIYFGMYAIWVGKVRELFFNKIMPEWDLHDTSFYILTRSFEHKFVRETREFNKVTIKMRISDYNSRFATLEHQIFGEDGKILGKGKQSLLFVSSKDYSLMEIPPEIYKAFINYA